MLATESGFRYLHSQLDLVNLEMESWIDYKNREYARQVETFISNKLSNLESVDVMPYHFFGELVKTEEGLALLNSTEIYNSLTSALDRYIFLIENGEELEYYETVSPTEKEELLLDLKSSLWALGHIGSSENGITLLELSGVVDNVAFIIENTINLSLKGICFFILGLVSKTDEGLEILDDLGYHVTTNASNENLPICLPKDINKMLQVPPPPQSIENKKVFIGEALLRDLMEDNNLNLNHKTTTVQFNNPTSTLAGLVGSSTLVSNNISYHYLLMKEIYENLNLILVNQTKAVSNLKNLKNKYFVMFDNEPIILKLVFKMLENYRYKWTVRKFLITELVNFKKGMTVIMRRNRDAGDGKRSVD
ncbi:unnamed protein product [Ambrosiozyma monospora]|uniref:Unnamed protein product n=1 Tax=Ambrosiozyma monospora TaxID=43982 RepID=A0ACB5TU54_AMBMO|nr:unnamed protein product [Ambrosiozyma monospora]